MSRSDFEQDILIDPEALDVECCRQAELFHKWSELASKVKGEVEKAKFDMDTVFARLDLKVRKRPGKYGLEDPKEAAVKATVSTHPDYLAAVAKYHDWRAESLWLDRAVDALEMKKRMLEELVKLHGLQYFAGPSSPRNLAKEWNTRRASREKRVTEKQKTHLRSRGS